MVCTLLFQVVAFDVPEVVPVYRVAVKEVVVSVYSCKKKSSVRVIYKADDFFKRDNVFISHFRVMTKSMITT